MSFFWRRGRPDNAASAFKADQCGVRITQLDGSAAGHVSEFPAEQHDILIGRNRDWAHVLLPADDRRPARKHLELRRQAGGAWEAVRQGETYTAVDGEPVSSRARLRHGNVLTLGRKDGPRLRFELLPPPVEGPAGDPDLTEYQDRPVEPETRLRRLGHYTNLIASCLVLVTLGGGAWLFDVDQRVRVHDAAIASLKTEMEGVAERARTVTEGWRAVSETLRDATYMVVARRGAEVWPVATAWAIGPAQLVTNAHVTAELAGKGVQITVRDRHGTEHPVTNQRPHPAYDPFRAFLRSNASRLGTSTPAGFRPARFPGAYDLALLELAPDANLPAALRPLSPAEAAGLRVGDEVAFAGYFLRGVEGGERLDQPLRVHFGQVTALTNFFLRDAEGERARLVHNNIPITGGTSGGPVVDREGRLVAIISSGTVLSVPAAGEPDTLAPALRTPSAALVNYAQRADVLHELLDGYSAFSAAQEQAAHWEPELTGFASYGDHVRDRFRAEIAEHDTRRFRQERQPEQVQVRRSFDIRRFTLDLEAGHRYGVLAYSHSREAVELRLDDGSGRACPDGGDPSCMDRGDPARLVFTADRTGPATLRVVTNSKEESSFQLFVYRTE